MTSGVFWVCVVLAWVRMCVNVLMIGTWSVVRAFVRAELCLAPNIGEGFFLVPISPPVRFEGVENRNCFFLDGRFCEQHLSERAVL